VMLQPISPARLFLVYLEDAADNGAIGASTS
jgi:hypothetical protein